MAGTVRLLFFAWMRERLGRREQVFALGAGDGATTVGAIEAALSAAEPAAREAFASGVVRAAVNGTLVGGRDAPVAAGDEVAFFPPVTGG